MKISNLKVYKSYFMTIGEFLERYYGFPKNSFPKFTHKDLCELMPHLKKNCDNSIIPKKICSGETILVVDFKNRIEAYNNPFSIEDINYKEFINNGKVNVQFLKEELIDIDKLNYDMTRDMNEYELEQTLRYCKKVKDNKNARVILNEFKFRPKTGCRKRKLEREKFKRNIEEEL